MRITKGADAVIQVSLTRKNLATGKKDPADLTSKTVKVVFRSSTALVEISDDDVSVVDARLGRFTFDIDKLVSDALKTGDLPFDVHVTDADNEVEIWKFKNEITVEDRIK